MMTHAGPAPTVSDGSRISPRRRCSLRASRRRERHQPAAGAPGSRVHDVFVRVTTIRVTTTGRELACRRIGDPECDGRSVGSSGGSFAESWPRHARAASSAKHREGLAAERLYFGPEHAKMDAARFASDRCAAGKRRPRRLTCRAHGLGYVSRTPARARWLGCCTCFCEKMADRETGNAGALLPHAAQAEDLPPEDLLPYGALPFFEAFISPVDFARQALKRKKPAVARPTGGGRAEVTEHVMGEVATIQSAPRGTWAVASPPDSRRIGLGIRRRSVSLGEPRADVPPVVAPLGSAGKRHSNRNRISWCSRSAILGRSPLTTGPSPLPRCRLTRRRNPLADRTQRSALGHRALGQKNVGHRALGQKNVGHRAAGHRSP